MIKKYVKKPIPIEAVQWTGSNKEEIKEFTSNQAKFVSHWIPTDDYNTITQEKTDLYIATLEGQMHANIGDFIIKGIHGEFYPCDIMIFRESYEEWVE